MNRAELIEALEKAEGPSREIDRDVAFLIGWYPDNIEDVGCFFDDPAKGCVNGAVYSPPAYTSSVDTALTLFGNEALAIYSLHEATARDVSRFKVIKTLCIAALKAMEQSDE